MMTVLTALFVKGSVRKAEGGGWHPVMKFGHQEIGSYPPERTKAIAKEVAKKKAEGWRESGREVFHYSHLGICRCHRAPIELCPGDDL